MTDPIVIFNFESSEIIIQCTKNETMRNIIQKFCSKIQQNSNSFIYLYGGGQVNLELTFDQQANQIDKENNEMKILVYKNESDGFKCPNCGVQIKIGDEIHEIIKDINNIKETINGIKLMIENIIKTSANNLMNIQLKNINIIINSINEDIKKNNEKLEKLLNYDNNNELINKNIIKGIIEINTNDINKNIVLFNTDINRQIDVYIDKKKINAIKEDNKWQYNFHKTGKYMLEIIFNDNITTCEWLFDNCSNIISLDLSNFNTANVTNMKGMFNHCHKLKEIKGINKFITNKVTTMNSMFQQCIELEYLDLSNFNTANVTDMKMMFNECHKLKEIIGINKFITNKVTTMSGMFQQCNGLEYLDLSNFNTANVTDMSFMFNLCHKLKYLNVSNFLINCETKNMFRFYKKECKFIANDKKLNQLYNSS